MAQNPVTFHADPMWRRYQTPRDPREGLFGRRQREGDIELIDETMPPPPDPPNMFTQGITEREAQTPNPWAALAGLPRVATTPQTAEYTGPRLNTEGALAGLKAAAQNLPLGQGLLPDSELYRLANRDSETVAPGANAY